MNDKSSDIRPEVLIVDDQPGDIGWLIDRIHDRGYLVALATNEYAARRRFEAVSRREESYAAAIVDVMVVIKDIEDLMELDDDFFRDSQSTGIRLCRYAREDLEISAKTLPIASLSVRNDDEVQSAMEELRIPHYNRMADSPSDSIDEFIEEYLPVLRQE